MKLNIFKSSKNVNHIYYQQKIYSIIDDNLYKYFPFGFLILKADILNILGIKNIPKGYNNPKPKLIIVSLIRCICVLTYIPQKQVI